MQVDDRVQYIVTYGDTAAGHVPVGTSITGTIVRVWPLGVDVQWDNPEITEVEIEYGLPRELLTPQTEDQEHATV